MPDSNLQAKTFMLTPIGSVCTSDQEGRYGVKVLPEYKEALLQLNQFSHVMVIWWANQHDNPADRKILTADLPYARGIRAGVFACRSEYRPNPICVTIMPVLEVDVEKGWVSLPWIDAFDGTSVLDLKPYMPVSDRIRDVAVADWLKDWPLWMEEAGEYFATHATDFGDCE